MLASVVASLASMDFSLVCLAASLVFSLVAFAASLVASLVSFAASLVSFLTLVSVVSVWPVVAAVYTVSLLTTLFTPAVVFASRTASFFSATLFTGPVNVTMP